jgi:hypothetical protein
MIEPRRHRVVTWDKENGYGIELVDVELSSDRLAAGGVAIGWDPVPYHLEFRLATGAHWVTTRLEVTARGDGWHRMLDLRRSAAGVWTIDMKARGDADPGLAPPGGDATLPAAALDCDLGLSPLTNSMPVLRHDLLRRDGSLDFVMAFVDVPALSVRASRQRYTTIGSVGDALRRIEYRALDSEFVSELRFDADGLVVDYPQLGRSVPAPPEKDGGG